MTLEIMGVGIQGPIGPGLGLNVEEYGAVGDGITDDTTAIEDAMDAASIAGLGIYLPPGEYPITALTVTVPIWGSGDASVLLASDNITCNTAGLTFQDFKVESTNDFIFVSANTSNITFRNVTINSTAASISAGYTCGISVYNTPRVRILNCRFNYAGIELSICRDFLIDGNYWDCEYLNIGEPCHVSAGSRGQFVNNTIYRSSSDCLDVYSDGAYCIITGNRFLSPRLTGSNGSVIEVKVVYSDDPGNTSVYPGEMINGTVISNNIIKDAQISSGSGVRTGINAFYLDSRSVPSFVVAETAVGISITDNILEDFQTTEAIAVEWIGIEFTGHNSLIAGNIIRNLEAVSNTTQHGIALAEVRAGGVADGIKCVGVTVRDNVIAGIGGTSGRGIYVGALENCVIDGNVIRTDEWSGITTKFGILAGTDAALTGCSISNNYFQGSVSGSMGVDLSGSGVTLTRSKVSSNVFRGCGLSIRVADYCNFTDNSLSNSTNSAGFAVGVASTYSTGNTFTGNHFTLSTDHALILTDCDAFTVLGCSFNSTNYPVQLVGNSKHGVIDNNVSMTSTATATPVTFSGVSAVNQATTYVGKGNRILNGTTTSAYRNVCDDERQAAAGDYIPGRELWINNSVSTASGTVLLSYFTARRTETITNLTTWTGATAAGATPTICRYGIYEIAADGSGTLVASTTNDTALHSVANTTYLKALTTPYQLVAGQRYALAYIVVSGAAMPTHAGNQLVNTAPASVFLFAEPRMTSRITGQSDLPASFSSGTPVGVQYRIGFQMT